MSTILDLAIAITVSDFATSAVKNVISQFRLLEGATKDVQAQMERFKNMAWGGGIAAAAGTAGLIATASAAKEAVKQAGDLQEVMTEIRAQTFGKDLFDPSKAEEIRQKMEAIRDLSNRLGLETTFSNLGVAQAIVEMQKGGVAIEDILSGAAEAAVKMAQLAKIPPNTAAEALVQARAGFQLTGEQLLQAADTMTKVAAASSADIGDIMRGLGNTSGQARRAGLNVMDTATLVALTRTTTATGEEAGTFVRNFLERLAPLTKESAKAMAAMGLLDKAGHSILVDAQGRAKSIEDIAAILRRVTAGMRSDEATKYLHKIFGEQGGRVAEVLLRQGTGSLEEIRKNVDSQLSLHERVRLQMQNFNQILDTARENWNIFMSALGTPLLASASWAFQLLGEKIALVTNYLEEHPQVSKYIFTIAGGVSAFLAIGGAITVAVASFAALQLALSTASISIGSIALASGGIVIAIAAIAGAAYLIYRNWDRVGPYFRQLWDTIKAYAQTAWGTLSGFVSEMAGPTMQALTRIGNAIMWVVRVTQPIWTAAWEVMKFLVVTTWNVILSAINHAWGVISGVFKAIVFLINGDWSALWAAVKQVAWNGILLLWDMFQLGILRGIGGIFGRAAEAAAGWGNRLIQSLANGIKARLAIVPEIIKGAFDTVRFLAETLVETAASWGSNLIRSFVNGIKAKLDIIPDALKGAAETIKRWLGVSSPTEEGPLRYNHLWGGNLIRSIATGMLNNLPVLRLASAAVAEAMSPAGTFYPGTGNPAREITISPVSPLGGGVIIQGPLIGAVYQQPGEDTQVFAERVAALVEARLGFKAQQANLTMGRLSFQGVR